MARVPYCCWLVSASADYHLCPGSVIGWYLNGFRVPAMGRSDGWHPPIALLAIAALYGRPGDAMCGRLAIMLVAVLAPGIIERREVDLLRMERQVISHRGGQVFDNAIWQSSTSSDWR